MGISLLVFMAAAIMLVVYLFKRKSLKNVKHLFLVGLALFIFSLFLPGPTEESTSPDKKNEDENVEEKEETDQTKDDKEREEEKDKDKESADKSSDADEKDKKSNQEKNQDKTNGNSEGKVNNDPETGDSSGSSQTSDKPSPNSNLESARVTRVVDGDTIEIQYKGKTEDVRLLLVDTPETVHPSKPVQPYGPEASSFAKKALSGKQVQVEFDGPKRDHYDRLLAYIWVDGKMFNQLLLEKGLARLAYVYDPPYTHYDAYVKAQTKAVNANRGIWSINGYVTEEGFNDSASGNSSDGGSSSGSGSGSSGSDSGSSGSGSGEVIYDPDGPDRDCGDFDTHNQAQNFFEAAGGPNSDPHRLDRDGNGLACESLP
ncbi:thermonuclease family protein [Salinibacillus aidingensis]